jgi:hydroxyacylglutathione hydrolase
MIKIHPFVFNDFQINTYILTGDDGKCIIVDPGCYYDDEKEQLADFFKTNGFEPVMALLTHGHVDHILGSAFVSERFNVPLYGHRDDVPLLDGAMEHGRIFGFEVEQPPALDHYLEDGSIVDFNGETLKIYHVPGHSPGSIAIHSEQSNFVIVGDALFRGSVGRSDLPGGNHNVLITSIKEKLMVLNDNLTVYPGHGPSTTIGNERVSNPFLI